MSFDAAELLFEDFVPESGLKLALSLRCGCDTHRVLPTAEEHVGLAWSDCGAVERCIRGISLQNLESASFM